MIRNLVRFGILVLLIFGSIFIWEKAKNFKIWGEDEVITTHNMVLKELTNMGQLELIKFSYRDVVEQEIKRDFLPDPKALLIVQGEAIGCIDLTKIKEEDIIMENDTLIITLPQPEICNYKIDHSKSKIYKTDYAFMNEAVLLDEAYRKAEAQILKEALASDILEQTKRNADLIFKPLLENITKKKVVIHYKLQGSLNRLK
ncbi:DUF4230 domain-containing protein [Lacihabitans lacunae]|jgi:hypothetical protein|uniref:DUF4230 domain-containing protein n=1 Tax=Lacihabitans lacunae TaxID=1028214 RepID=A0ABV7Z1A7_9BACT